MCKMGHPTIAHYAQSRNIRLRLHDLVLCSPWVKILERPGDEHGNRSEEVQIENPYKNPDAPDSSYDVPEKVRCCH